MHSNEEGGVFGWCAVVKNAKLKSSITMQYKGLQRSEWVRGVRCL